MQSHTSPHVSLHPSVPGPTSTSRCGWRKSVQGGDWRLLKTPTPTHMLPFSSLSPQNSSVPDVQNMLSMRRGRVSETEKWPRTALTLTSPTVANLTKFFLLCFYFYFFNVLDLEVAIKDSMKIIVTKFLAP